MADLREQQKQEAIKRMKKLGIMEQPIKEFEEEGKVNLSEGPGLLYWLNDEEQEMVRKFEEDSNGLVYHVIKTQMNFGLMYSFLYVSEHIEEWEMDVWERKWVTKMVQKLTLEPVRAAAKMLREKKCFSLVIATASHLDWSVSIAMKN